MKKKDLLAKLDALGDISEDQRNSIACTFIGHSNIIETCFGYVYCARCGDQIGDSIAGAYSNPDCVIVGHDCQDCRDNAKRLTWRDKLFITKPLFKCEAV